MIVNNILKVIEGGISYLTLLLKTSHVRKLRKAVDYGETFITNFYDLVDEDDTKKKRQIRKRMNYCKIKFFKYNQG